MAKFNDNLIKGAFSQKADTKESIFGVMGQLKDNSFKIVTLDIDTIVENDMNAEYSKEHIDELATSILEVGLKQNLTVRPISDGKYKLITGNRRYLALKKLVAKGYEEFKNVPCMIENLDDINLPLDNDLKEKYSLITTNIQRRVNTTSDLLKFKRDLEEIYDELQKQGYSLGKRREFMAEILGMSERSVQDLITVDKGIANPTIREKLENDEIPVAVAKEIAAKSKSEQKKFAKHLEENPDVNLTKKEVQEFFEKEEKKAEKKKAKALEKSQTEMQDETVYIPAVPEEVIEPVNISVDETTEDNPSIYDELREMAKKIENKIVSLADAFDVDERKAAQAINILEDALEKLGKV